MSTLKISGDSCLAEVLHFAEVFFKCVGGETKSQWAVAVTQEPGYSMIPLFAINSRVVYARRIFDFGRVIGSQSVIIAVPLEHSNFC